MKRFREGEGKLFLDNLIADMAPSVILTRID